MERNLSLYPYYQVGRHSLFWVPIFFLYFSSLLTVDDVLALEAIYYLSVVLLEVPSGYFSDRIGRRVTLIAGNLAGVFAFGLFVAGRSFLVLAAAQVLLAVWMSFNSGTDTSLLYDSLLSLDRAAEVGQREAKAQSRGYLAYACAALVGGACAGFDLRIPYLLSGVGALFTVAVALRFREPEVDAAKPALMQLKTVAARATQPWLSWLFVFVVAMTVFAHVPYMLFQPYLKLLFVDLQLGSYELTPLVAGGLVTAAMLASSAVSARAMHVARRFGTLRTLLGALLLQAAIILAMGLVLHPWMLLPLTLRSVPSALMKPPMNAAVHARIDSAQRATYFSVQSLAGRLAFSATLFVASRAVGGLDTLTRPALAQLCIAYSIGAALMLALLLLLATRIKTASDAAK